MTVVSPPEHAVDPVTVEVVRNAFSSIARQMNNNLARSAYTPIIYEMKDCSVGVFDRKGRLLGQSPGLPMFLGNLETGIKVTTEMLGGTEHYRPGDVFMVNDPYLVGSHTYDVTIFSPIFLGDRLVGFGATKAHWIDIGAKEAGRPVDTTEIYQEGYRFGPTYVYRAGEPQTQMLDYITRNSRLPRSVWGDLHAQISACRTGERRMVELCERFGVDVVEAAAEEIFAQCERLDREAVVAVPDGVYRAEGAMDSGGPGLPPVPVKVTVTVSGDRMTIDLTGSGGPTAGSVNSPLPGTVAGARLAYKCLINPNVPVTDGTFRNLSVVAPPGTVFNVAEPHATIYYYPPLGLMIDLVIRALADALPDAVVAGQPADPMNVTFVGTLPDGGRYVTGEATAVGWGASSSGDGANGMINYGAGDLKNYPVEVLESRYPIRVLRYGLRDGSGGEGRFRGGLGIVREYETLAEETYLSLWLERSTLPGWGLHGGGDGAPTHGEIVTGDVRETVLKTGARRLAKGARVLVMTGGGGGYGSPALRDPESLAADLADGYVQD
ncbi:hydantoinase B/oxoprolinase family protein [Rhizohabitans arisaemae]|uniref:hydantoinase B/oxoprolinase family protein n=1 Tax=Rhizohabitans arisaemae TaxID=2720610 RepID=UPI0024B22D44|nr:hydantoinase B/oxoprolinase family protein [Rhizohabitans arisaemae]